MAEEVQPEVVESTETSEQVEPPVTVNEPVEKTVKQEPKETTENLEAEKLQKKLETKDKKVMSLETQVNALESVVQSVVDSKLEGLSKEYHGLIPEGDATSKLDWITKAEKAGLFKKAEVKEVKDVEIGKPLTLPNKDEKVNSKLTAQQKMSNFFDGFYNKK